MLPSRWKSQEGEIRKGICSTIFCPLLKLIMHIFNTQAPLFTTSSSPTCSFSGNLIHFLYTGAYGHMAADHDLADLVRRCNYAPSSSSPTRMAPSVDRPLDQKPSKEAVLGRRQFHVTSIEEDVTAYPDIESWVKRSQNPKTGLARTSRTAYATISASTLMLRDPSAIPQIL